MPEVTLITTSQVADKYQITASAVRRWVAAGKLKPAVTTPGGHYRFRESDVADLLAAEPVAEDAIDSDPAPEVLR